MIPKILLIGCGNFGKNHLRVLRDLDNEYQVILKGIVVKSKESAEKLGRLATTSLTTDLLKSVDAVIITTPASTHYEIVKWCLPYTDVFVEKPLSLSVRSMKTLRNLAKSFNRVLMVGHIYRFNNAAIKAKSIVRKYQDSLYYVEGKLIGGGEPEKDCGVISTMLHLFDILDFIFEKTPISIQCSTKTILDEKFEDHAVVNLDYGDFAANLELSRLQTNKQRTLLFKFKDGEYACNLMNAKKEPLRLELEHFLKVLKKEETDYPDADLAIRIGAIVEAAYKSAR